MKCRKRAALEKLNTLAEKKKMQKCHITYMYAKVAVPENTFLLQNIFILQSNFNKILVLLVHIHARYAFQKDTGHIHFVDDG